ncbi:MAG: YicC family protein [Candidatus Hydrogenedentes bacterium]|nr:YicC family protein [Candidatus Hydrogenedentota bacterium]
MPRSMTGFGKASCDLNGTALSVELCAVNHRYLDCYCRIPTAWMGLEPVIKQTIRERISRGKISVSINRRRPQTTDEVVHFDRTLAQQYIEASRELAQMLGTYETLSLNILAQMEGVLYQEEPEADLDGVSSVVVKVLGEAITQLNTMRVSEGSALCEDLRQRVAVVREALATVEERLPLLNQAYEERLRSRINELKSELTMSEDRVAIEVALLADKGDVTEEVVRLKTHLDHMLELLESEEPVGRRLDFLIQEVQREINTLGVKTRDGDVTKEVLRMKSELEKIREQIQNIE